MRQYLWLVLLCALVVACTPVGTPPTGTPDFRDLEITLERTPCFGRCPYYKVTIKGDGSVVYEGKKDVKATGTQTATIDRTSLEKLIAAFQATDYFALPDSYDPLVTDLPTTMTSIRLNGRVKSVRNYGMCMADLQGSAPQKLCDLENLIDEISGANAWVGRE